MYFWHFSRKYHRHNLRLGFGDYQPSEMLERTTQDPVTGLITHSSHQTKSDSGPISMLQGFETENLLQD